MEDRGHTSLSTALVGTNRNDVVVSVAGYTMVTNQ